MLMEDARSGGGPPFTAAVIIIALVISGFLIWRMLPNEIATDKPAIMSTK
jgi:hypothetical protein